MSEVFIYDAVRSPRGKGKRDGALHSVRPVVLLKHLFDALLQRNDFKTESVDDVVLGCVTQIGEQGGNIARIAALHAGWHQSVPGFTLNRFCASGLESVNLAFAKVASGMESLVVAGGVESMSRWSMGSDGGAMMMDPSVNNAIGFIPQGVSADLIATREGFSRTELDQFALRSHARAAAARNAGHFKSIIGIRDINGRMILDQDETIRQDTSIDAMSRLEPAFASMGALGFDATARLKYPDVGPIQHLHHAGNASGIVDGAALVLIGDSEVGASLGLRPRARIRAYAVVGTEPTIMLTGPTPATQRVLARAKMDQADIDLFEINEAFAAVVLKAQRDLDLDMDRVNVHGGAIAMGHPLGATGAVLLGTLLDALETQDKTTGLVTLCVGAGMGIATVIERV